MLRKLKPLFLLIPILLLTSCGENDPIFENLDGDGKLIYLGIIISLAIIGFVLKFLFKIVKGKKQPGTSSQPGQQPLQQQQIQRQQPTSSTMPPLPSVEMINELSKTESPKEIV
jgi:hypothetical protein